MSPKMFIIYSLEIHLQIYVNTHCVLFLWIIRNFIMKLRNRKPNLLFFVLKYIFCVGIYIIVKKR